MLTTAIALFAHNLIRLFLILCIPVALASNRDRPISRLGENEIEYCSDALGLELDLAACEKVQKKISKDYEMQKFWRYRRYSGDHNTRVPWTWYDTDDNLPTGARCAITLDLVSQPPKEYFCDKMTISWCVIWQTAENLLKRCRTPSRSVTSGGVATIEFQKALKSLAAGNLLSDPRDRRAGLVIPTFMTLSITNPNPAYAKKRPGDTDPRFRNEVVKSIQQSGLPTAHYPRTMRLIMNGIYPDGRQDARQLVLGGYQFWWDPVDVRLHNPPHNAAVCARVSQPTEPHPDFRNCVDASYAFMTLVYMKLGPENVHEFRVQDCVIRISSGHTQAVSGNVVRGAIHTLLHDCFHSGYPPLQGKLEVLSSPPSRQGSGPSSAISKRGCGFSRDCSDPGYDPFKVTRNTVDAPFDVSFKYFAYMTPNPTPQNRAGRPIRRELALRAYSEAQNSNSSVMFENSFV